MIRLVLRLLFVILPICTGTAALTLWTAPSLTPGWELLYAWREGQMQSWTVQRMDVDRHLSIAFMRGFLFWESLRYSPDRRLIAGYVEADQLALFNPSRSGEGVRRLGRGIAPTWSPDGRFLAYQSEGMIYVREISAEGEAGTAVQISHSEGDIAFTPRWSPDGEWLTFETEAYVGIQRDAAEIYIVRRDGSNLQQLTDDYINPASNPVWSPDGSALIFTTYDGMYTTFHHIDLASGEGQSLAQHPAFVRGAAWSGTKLAFFSITRDDIALYILPLDENRAGNYEPYRVSEVTPELRVDMMWSPDGKRLAFIGIHNGDIYIASADGQSLTQRLTDSPQHHILLP